MATTQSASHKAAQKKLSKAEFKLFSQSQPAELKKIPRERVRKARARAMALVKRHRKNARLKADDKVASKEVGFRLRSMEKVLDRFDRVLHKDRAEKRKAKALRGKKSLTAQPKMHVKRQDEPREAFLHQTKQRIYDKNTVLPRANASAVKNMGKRIAGYTSARSRKGQVARDRNNSSEG